MADAHVQATARPGKLEAQPGGAAPSSGIGGAAWARHGRMMAECAHNAGHGRSLPRRLMRLKRAYVQCCVQTCVPVTSCAKIP